jgi:hypothetical protein
MMESAPMTPTTALRAEQGDQGSFTGSFVLTPQHQHQRQLKQLGNCLAIGRFVPQAIR